MKMKQIISAMFCVFVSTVVVADTDYSEMIVFGDSLSDPGNVFALTGSVSVRPYNAGNVPDAPYPVGGLHFSNGETWAEQLSALLKLKGGTGPALRAPVFTNYAFGGSRAAPSAGGAFDISAQVSQYLSSTGGSADDDALYVVYFGGNDVRDALVVFNATFEQTLLSGGTLSEAFAAATVAAEALLYEAVTSIAENIIALNSAGARHFLVPGVPNLGLVPAIRELGPNAVALASNLSSNFNNGLLVSMAFLENVIPVNFTYFDVFSLTSNVAATPEAYGLLNGTDACITPEVNQGAICKRPDDYLFWDGIHPTRVGHRVLAESALSALQ